MLRKIVPTLSRHKPQSVHWLNFRRRITRGWSVSTLKAGKMAQKLHPQARRLRTIIVTVPIMGATALVLYERLVLGKPQRTIPRPNKDGVPKESEIPAEGATGKVGGPRAPVL